MAEMVIAERWYFGIIFMASCSLSCRYKFFPAIARWMASMAPSVIWDILPIEFRHHAQAGGTAVHRIILNKQGEAQNAYFYG
jgi:hypothetical protein